MKTTIEFRDVSALPSARNYLTEVFERLSRFERNLPFRAKVILSKARGRSSSHQPVFNCELILSGHKKGTPLVVIKERRSFYRAVGECVLTAEKILRRTSKIRPTSRRSQQTLRGA